MKVLFPSTSLSACLQGLRFGNLPHFQAETRLAMSTSSTQALPYPRAAVAMTMQAKLDNDNYYLLVQRANAPEQGMWCLPGGKIEVGEATMDAAQRELSEETQLQPSDCQWYPFPFMTTDAIYQQEGEDGDYSFHYLLAHCFGKVHSAQESSLPTIIASDDALDAKWWTLAQIRQELQPEDIVSKFVPNVIRRAEDLSKKGALDENDTV